MLTKPVKEYLSINRYVSGNFSRLRPSLFIAPLILMTGIVLYLFLHDSLHETQYINIQKDCFYFLNAKLSQFPTLMFNLTQLGDHIIILSFIGILVYYAPKIWESLLTASLVSCLFCTVLKKIFAVPRPAAVFDQHSFVIIGKVLNGHNSLPSGHSISAITILTVVLFAFIPQQSYYKILWCILIFAVGTIVVLSRVGVGAHYPLDVVIGSTIGYLSGLSGIFINEKYRIWNWINNKRYYPVFMLFFLICAVCIVSKIMDDHLVIFYMALVSLIISLFKIIHVYVKK